MPIFLRTLMAIAILLITPFPRARAHGFIDQQIVSLSKQIDVSPGNLNLRIKRANLNRENGNLDSARNDIRFVLASEPDQAKALLLLAQLERESKNFAVAQQAIDEFIAKNADQSSALKERALILSETNQWHQASKAWQTYLVSATRPDPESFLACVEAIQKQSPPSINAKQALQVIRAGLKRHPHVISLNQRMASLLIQSGDYKTAQKYFTLIREKYPTLNPRLFAEEARIWQSYGWSTHAVVAYTKAEKAFESLPQTQKLKPGFQSLKKDIDEGLEMSL